MTENNEKHPEWYFSVPNMKTLVIGTFPPKLYRDYDFYYPNSTNWMWEVIAKLGGKTLKNFENKEAVVERKQLLLEQNIGLENLGKEIIREGDSSKDSDITIVEYHDILGLIRKSPNLKTIILTGYSGTFTGQTSSYHSFINYIRKHPKEIFCGPLPFKPKAGLSFMIKIDERREIECFIANSTSRLSARSGVTPEKLVEQFSKAIKKAG